MSFSIPQSIQTYAVVFAQRALGRISAPLKIISRADGTERVLYEDKPRQSDEVGVICVNDPNFWNRILSDFDLGFAESYMLQEIDCENLGKIFDVTGPPYAEACY
ncbi:uncharacterized protein LDX57_008533 [Aspergillus melleus]|uniref:uncharacterized protein n=1 Tax=Aspergillus melleus TaxID=138277 RepID=UPI001E8EF1BD|nr:uncharacterized protein LDX57_008533 [Aspergillus melleus]KAH8430869.1 hypothetical protein LDX57_008533 [Aspergillus melleus]